LRIKHQLQWNQGAREKGCGDKKRIVHYDFLENIGVDLSGLATDRGQINRGCPSTGDARAKKSDFSVN
jgi:hypothetical protein